ncbi:Nuclear transport factor 2 [Macleaya cordata]|uniref:NTF2-related export protein n=1 Tax=Macleaya cordata TaxID=56857 RepID=A0A200QGF1_MACCD|nr:Nuclear transport factor 2 [Macleaya cordata]
MSGGSSSSTSSSADDQMSSVVDNFLKEYYKAFDDNPVGLFEMYHDDAVFSMEGEKINSKMKILHKLNGIYFRMCKHTNIKFDYQPLPDAGLLVSVIGTVVLPGKSGQTFSQNDVIVMEKLSRGGDHSHHEGKIKHVSIDAGLKGTPPCGE